MICPTFAIYKAKLESNFQIQNKTKQKERAVKNCGNNLETFVTK